MGKIVLIDGSSLLFRAFYAIRELTTKDGIYTNGVYGFLSMYYRIVDQYAPDYVCVAFDRSGPTFREEDYAAYKGNRQETPSELSAQFGILKDVLDSMGVVHLDLDGYEADDICGTLGRVFSQEGHQVILFTGDRDFLQLVGENRQVVLTKKGISEIIEYDTQRILDEYGIQPQQFIDVKGLMGDASDNIPGIPGIGEKTALKLIREYGSMDGIYESIDQVSGKAIKQKLIDGKDIAYLSRSLGEIFLNAPIDLELDSYLLRSEDVEELRRKFERLEFRTFASRLPKPEVELEVRLEQVVLGEENLQEFLLAAKKAGRVTFKFFSDENYALRKRIEAVGFKLPGEPRVYLAQIQKPDAEVEFSQGSLFETDPKELQSSIKTTDSSRLNWECFNDLFTDSALTKGSFDVKEEMLWLKNGGVALQNYDDAMIMDYLLDPSQTGMTMEKQLEKHVGIRILSRDELQGKGKKRIPLEDIAQEALFDYIAQVVHGIEKLFPYFTPMLEERQMTELYQRVELPLIEVLTEMEHQGFQVDIQVLEDLGREFQEVATRLEHGIYEDAGVSFNINSPKQLGEVLFDQLKLPVVKKTKTGYSTDAQVLEKLSGQHPIVEKILEYRSIVKLIGTYIDGLTPLIREDGRIHSTFKQNIAATGRISSTDPNLQNIPIKTEEGRRIRKAFVPKAGYLLVDADYSQIELRVLAHLSQDEAMIKAFLAGDDFHTRTASEVFHTPLEEVTPLQRSRAKAVNFGIIYGISDFGLSRDLDIPRAEAKEYIERYLDTYPMVRQYMESIVEQGRSDGYVETILHRRRYIPELASSNHNIRGFGERIALNTPIQGSAADIIKVAMVDVYHELKKRGLASRLILQVHDELIVEAHEDEVEEVKVLLQETMESAMTLSIPIKVDVNTGSTWYESK